MTFTEYPAQDREVLWEKRYYLTEIPGEKLSMSID
jgi:hypothetical protein